MAVFPGHGLDPQPWRALQARVTGCANLYGTYREGVRVGCADSGGILEERMTPAAPSQAKAARAEPAGRAASRPAAQARRGSITSAVPRAGPFMTCGSAQHALRDKCGSGAGGSHGSEHGRHCQRGAGRQAR